MSSAAFLASVAFFMRQFVAQRNGSYCSIINIKAVLGRWKCNNASDYLFYFKADWRTVIFQLTKTKAVAGFFKFNEISLGLLQ